MSLSASDYGFRPIDPAASGISDAQRAAFGAAPQGVPGRDYRMLMGVIRNDGGPAYWQPINDGFHRPHFITSVETDAYTITVNFAAGSLGQVGTFLAVPDETLAMNGFLMGPSVTPDRAILTLSKIDPSVSDYISYNGSAWVSQDGLITVSSFTSGVLTLTHETIKLSSQYNFTLQARGGVYTAVVSGAGSAVSGTSMKVEFRDWAGTLITTPDTNMKLYVSHGGGFRRANPQLVTTATYPASNIWLFGVNELTAGTP